MSPEEVKTLREALGCTARELAAALRLEQRTVLAWERGELFPTKKHVAAMERLRDRGPDAPSRKPRGDVTGNGLEALGDPAVWQLIRKLLAHPELRAAATKLAADYSDPTSKD